LFGTFANLYTGAANLTSLAPGSISMVGGSQAHNNTQPYLTLSFCIALQGIFPSQN
jgi:microcystin-dependent protein